MTDKNAINMDMKVEDLFIVFKNNSKKGTGTYFSIGVKKQWLYNDTVAEQLISKGVTFIDCTAKK